MFAINRNLKKVGFYRSTDTRPVWKRVTGDEAIGWNTEPPRDFVRLYERVCSCGFTDRCNCPLAGAERMGG